TLTHFLMGKRCLPYYQLTSIEGGGDERCRRGALRAARRVDGDGDDRTLRLTRRNVHAGATVRVGTERGLRHRFAARRNDPRLVNLTCRQRSKATSFEPQYAAGGDHSPADRARTARRQARNGPRLAA